jgi:uncharacterized protein (DUF2236 family)
MTRAEQQRLLEDLLGQMHRMKPADREAFLAFQSRDKDDEDLDAAAASQLRRLHDAYRPPKSKKELDDLWNKMTSGRKGS